MKKLLLQFLLLALPCIVLAQKNPPPPLFQDFGKKVIEITTSFKFDEHTTVYQLNTDNQNFELVALDDDMKQVWRSSFKGYPLAAGKFKGKIVAIASTEHSYFKGQNNTYQAIVIDPATGKSTFDKIIYDSKSGHVEYATFLFNESGSLFKMVLRESGADRKMHAALPGMLAIISIDKANKQLNAISSLTITDFNEQLEPTFSFSPDLPKDNLFTGLTNNNNGDIFLALYNPTGVLSVIKYKNGSKEAEGQLDQQISTNGNGLSKTPDEVVKLFASNSNPNVLYLAGIYKTPSKDYQSSVIKFDFANKIKKMDDELFTKDHIKNLQKGSERINKDVDKPDMGSAEALDVRYINEFGGKLIVTISGRFIQSGQNVQWDIEKTLLVNGYDLDLNPKFQELFPMYNAGFGRFASIGYHEGKGLLNILANYQVGYATNKGLCGQLNLETGRWVKMDVLSKKKLDNGDYTDAGYTSWGSDGYIVPYMSRRGFSLNYDVILQKNDY